MAATPPNVERLRCIRCGAAFSFQPDAYLCPTCGFGEGDEDPGILDVEYDYPRAAEGFRAGLGSRRDVFRYLALLPLAQAGETLPAGDTPLVPAPRLARRLGVGRVFLKDETRNPTRCLKDRATSVAMTLGLTQGHRDFYCASAGNAAISLAGFAAHQGVACHVFVPSYVSRERLSWLERYGADVNVSRGGYDDAVLESEAAGGVNDWYSRNCAFNPFLVEGKKTAAFEIAEQLDWSPPDVVLAPVGDGCTLAALGKGFRELETLGLIDGRPRLVGIQAEAVQPLVRRLNGTTGEDSGDTAAVSINVRRPRNALRLLRELEGCGGAMRAVTDDQIRAAQAILARQAGVVAEFTAAAGLAGLADLAANEELVDKTVVVVVTGGRVDER